MCVHMYVYTCYRSGVMGFPQCVCVFFGGKRVCARGSERITECYRQRKRQMYIDIDDDIHIDEWLRYIFILID